MTQDKSIDLSFQRQTDAQVMLNRNFVLIVLSSIVLGAPMPMLILLGALAGQSLAPVAALATAPASIGMLAGIVVAIPISIYMGRAGRRNGFLVGAIFMIAGGLVAALALAVQSFLLLCIAHFILGAAFVSLNFFRFAAAEAVPTQWKAKAISYTLASGLIAAFIGPLIYTHFKDALLPIPFAGAYLALAGLGLLGCIPLTMLSRMLPVQSTVVGAETVRVSKRQVFSRPVVMLAILSAAVAQASMLLLMVPTPLAMEAHGHAGHLGADVIRWHVIAMFAPGFFTGSLIQRFGSTAIISVGFLLLIVAGLMAAHGISVRHFYLSLVLLGVGWNFGFIGGTHLLQSAVSDQERPLIQGVNDTIVAIASSGASLSAGALYAGFGWAELAVTTVVFLAIAMVILTVGKRSVVTG